MSKEINTNGFDYVDLGLPSGTLWATCNIGASKPYEYGWYFQWGDTTGYSRDRIGISNGQKEFALDFTDYKFSIDKSSKDFIKYTSEGATLDIRDDAAYINMGGDWHMPTPDQIHELVINTTSAWTKLGGIEGMTFTSKKDMSKYIFIPAAGCIWNGQFDGEGIDGCIWSSMLSRNNISNGQYLDIQEDGINLYPYGSRVLGFPVRGVIDNWRDKNNMEDNNNIQELIKNEIINNLRIQITSDYNGYVNIELLYKDEVISDSTCQVTTNPNPLDE